MLSTLVIDSTQAAVEFVPGKIHRVLRLYR